MRPPTVHQKPLRCCAQAMALVAGVAFALWAETDLAPGALKAIGHSAVPVLVKRLQTKNTRLGSAEALLWQCAQRLNLLRSPRLVLNVETKRAQAVWGLLQLGDVARPALPTIAKLAKSDPAPDVRASALEVLRYLSPSDYAELIGQTNVVSAAAR